MSALLYFLSKTDQGIVSKCPASTKNIQATLGFFVLMTGLLALFSGSYAVSNMFVHEDSITGKPVMMKGGWFFSGLIGCIYCMFIMAIDREIVSASSKLAVIFRIPLAVIISLVISVPIELRIFDSKITKKLQVDAVIERDSLRNKLSREQGVSNVTGDIDSIESDKRDAIKRRNYWSEMMEIEKVGRQVKGATGVPGEGDAYTEAERNKIIQDSLISYYERELTKKNTILSVATQRTDSGYTNDRVPQSYDLLSKYIALKEVKIEDKTGSAKGMGRGILLLFFLFELIPSIMKLLLPLTEYDALLDKRRRLNRQATKLIFQHVYNQYEEMEPDEIRDFNPTAVQKMYDAQAR